MNNPDQKKPKIIIDEDWKTQVQEEKEALKHSESRLPEEKTDSQGDEPLPPASFAAHVVSLATQATAALGQFPDPNPGNPAPAASSSHHHSRD